MKKLLSLIVVLITVSSCSVTYHSVTNNPIGSKVGVANGTNFNPDLDFTYIAAAKKGDIDKIGTTEFKVTSYFFFFKYQTKLTGE